METTNVLVINNDVHSSNYGHIIYTDNYITNHRGINIINIKLLDMQVNNPYYSFFNN